MEPWGEEWLRTGTVAAAIYNSNPYRKRGSKPINPDDFVWRPLKKKKKHTPEKMFNALAGLAEATAGVKVRPDVKRGN